MDSLTIRTSRLSDSKGIRKIHRNCDDPWHDTAECYAWVEKRLNRGSYIQVAQVGGKDFYF